MALSQAWQESELCKVIVINSSNQKSFCAGGDVKSIVLAAKSKDPIVVAGALKFFETEYQLNHLLATLKKPVVSVLDGITMGGGVGISVHGHFRIVTENSVFAMPETSIGLFPDVGGSFFLPRLDGQLGIGTHFVPAARLPSLMARLSDLESDEFDIVNSTIDEFSGTFSKSDFENWSLGDWKAKLISRCFKFDTIEEIITALEKESSSKDVSKWVLKQLDTLKSVSPTSLKVTLEQLRRGSKMCIAECFKMEYKLVQQFLQTPDFIEGVQAKLIDKPARAPQWAPKFSDMGVLTRPLINSMFFESKNKAKLGLLNKLSYFDYPHRTLSGLPTDKDIKRVVQGTAKRGQTSTALSTKLECLNWVQQNWGRYDSGVIGSTSIPRQNTLDGGSGRSKVSLVEKTSALLDRHVQETPKGLVWID